MPNECVERHQNFSDEQLISLVVGKDADALEMLYYRHAQTIFQVAQRIVHEIEIAEELVQETFWQVWQRAEQYRGVGSAFSWMLRIARNKAIDHLRWRKAHPLTNDDPLEMLETTAQLLSASVEEEVEQRWLGWQLQKAMDRLPDKQRLCLELAYFQGMSQSEIAEHTQTPLGTIKTRIRIGMEKLAHMLYGNAAFAGAN